LLRKTRKFEANGRNDEGITRKDGPKKEQQVVGEGGNCGAQIGSIYNKGRNEEEGKKIGLIQK
jgi:hypothetical protein